jgi:hypothetical protein
MSIGQRFEGLRRNARTLTATTRVTSPSRPIHGRAGICNGTRVPFQTTCSVTAPPLRFTISRDGALNDAAPASKLQTPVSKTSPESGGSGPEPSKPTNGRHAEAPSQPPGQKVLQPRVPVWVQPVSAPHSIVDVLLPDPT